MQANVRLRPEAASRELVYIRFALEGAFVLMLAIYEAISTIHEMGHIGLGSESDQNSYFNETSKSN